MPAGRHAYLPERAQERSGCVRCCARERAVYGDDDERDVHHDELESEQLLCDHADPADAVPQRCIGECEREDGDDYGDGDDDGYAGEHGDGARDADDYERCDELGYDDGCCDEHEGAGQWGGRGSVAAQRQQREWHWEWDCVWGFDGC